MVSTLASGPSCPGFKPLHSPKIVDVAEVNQWRCLEESGQWLENVDEAHLVLTGVTKRTQKFSLSQLSIAKTLVKY